MRLKDFFIDGKIVYNNIEYNILDIVYEAIIYGISYNSSINRKSPYAWVNVRKQLYTREFLTDVFKCRNTCDKVARMKRKYIYILKHGSLSNFKMSERIKLGELDNCTRVKDVESLISKDIYKKYLYGDKIILPQKKILRKQHLIYDAILPENHYDYNTFYKSKLIEYTSDLYRELADLMGYFIPDGENAMEFCYLLLGENETEDYLKELIECSGNEPDSFYGKFKEVKKRR